MNKLQIIEQEAAEELEQLKARIVDYDREVRSAFNRQMGFAFLAGVALNRAAEILPHNQLGPWMESNFPESSRRTLYNYRNFSTKLIEAHPAVGKSATVALLGEGGFADIPTDDQKRVLKAVHDLADGKTLTEMYRDLGVIRQPEKPKHHPRKPLTPAEERDAAKLHARDLLNAWTGPLRVFLNLANDEHDADALPLDKADWELALAIGTELTAMARERLKHGKRGAK